MRGQLNFPRCRIASMRLIAIKNLRNEAYQYPDTKKAIETWYLIAKNSDCGLAWKMFVNRVLAGQEIINTSQAKALADRFKLSPQIFLNS
jgi:hypothetical protein